VEIIKRSTEEAAGAEASIEGSEELQANEPEESTKS
jgi:hypothetical protein